MKQVLLYPKAAAPVARELPDPAQQTGYLIIDNRASVISPGTERASVKLHKASLVTKARRRPDLVKKVIEKARTEGLAATISKVRSRLAEPFAPGYSCAGVVTEIGDGVDGYSVGDRVAAAGYGHASHAERISVPTNLTAKIPDAVNFAGAAFGTLGAIALHGVRVTAPTLGETVVVLGLGILGQLTVQILRAAGIQVIAIEPDQFRRELAMESGIDRVTVPGREAQEMVLAQTDRRGADAVIITAASTAEDLADQSAELVRDRGVITVVGDVPLVLSRRIFYEKELQLRLSRSYGPGRYDRQYEERGHDYPFAYVRWTEKRNIESFLDLLAQKKVAVDHLITDRFTIEQAEKAYQMLEDPDSSRHLVVLFEYPEKEHHPIAAITLKSAPSFRKTDATLGVGFVGFGQFAGGVLLPAFKSIDGIKFTGVATRKSLTAHTAADQGGFDFATTDHALVVNNRETDIVVIATTHELHADLAIEALAAGKAVFLEKPMALDAAGLARLVKAVREHGGLLQVGFNRRYSPALSDIKNAISGRTGPLSIDYRVCAGPAPLPAEHWVTDPEVGGGRLIGEVCHFIDAVIFLTGAYPTTVYARSLAMGEHDDAVIVTLEMNDGSVAQIRYLTWAGPNTPKEVIDIVGSGFTARVDDFRSHEWVGVRGRARRSGTQDKGHAAQLKAFVHSLRQKGVAAGDFAAAVYATQATFVARDSLRLGKPVAVSCDI